MKGLMQIIVKFRAEKFLRTFLSPNVLLRGMKYRLQKKLCSFENESIISFSYTIWFMISEKISQGARFFTVVHACTKSLKKASKTFFQPFKLHLCGLVVFNSYVYVVFNDTVILTEGGRGFKTFLKENYAIALDSCYLFTKKC